MKYFLLFFLVVWQNCLVQAQQPCTVPIGATLSPLYWNFNTSNWFVDYMKMSKPGFGPISGPWDPGGPALTADGWPTEPFSVWVKLGVYSHDLGVYHLRFEGFAQLSPDLGIQIFDQTYDPVTNITNAKVRITSDANQIALFFNAPMSATVRNIKLIAPGFDPNAYPTFQPDWVEHAAKFPLLRFMTWNAAFYDGTVLWQDRNMVDSPTQAPAVVNPQKGEGIAWEYVLEMANLTGAHIWISVPILADDDYIRKLATILRDGLSNPDQQVHIELANEVWNTAQYPYQANRQQAIAEVGAGGSNLNFDGSTNPDTWAQRRYARRTMEMGAIFLDVFGQAAFNKRIFPVLGHQVVSPGNQLRTALEYIDQNYGPPNEYFSAVAGAPLLPLLQMDTVSNLTVDKYFQIAQQQINKLYRNEDSFLTEGIGWATYYKVPYRSHEAGVESFLSRSAPFSVRQTVVQAQSDPRMKELIREYLDRWYQFAGPEGMLTWFVAGATDWQGGDATGLVNNLQTIENQKTAALDEILAMQCPPLQSGFAIPGSVDARQHTHYPTTWQATPFNQVMFQGNQHQYLVRAEHPGNYCLSVALEKPTFADAAFQLSVNNVIIDTITVPGGQSAGIDTVFFAQMQLSPGLHTVRLKYLTWCYGTHKLFFKQGTNCTSSVTELETVEQMKIYPNPNDGQFIVTNLAPGQLLSVYHPAGYLVYQTKVQAETATIKLDQKLWGAGLYFVQAGQEVMRILLLKDGR